MSDDATTELKPELKAWFAAWESCIQQVLTQVSGQAVTFEVSPGTGCHRR